MTGYEAPLSFGQQRLWFIEQLAPGNTGYVNQDATMLLGELDEAALEAALRVIVTRHESLRTRFRRSERDAGPVQWVQPTGRIPLTILDAAEVPAAERAPFLQQLARAEAARGFDLESDDLVRCHLVRWAPRERALLILAHHIVVDGWSLTNLRRELAVAYNARVAGVEPDLPELRVQYPDFAVWQRDQLGGAQVEEELAFWRGYLDGSPGVLELPTDRPRPERPTMTGDLLHLKLPRAVLDQARQLAAATRTTLYMVLASVVAVVLGRYAGQPEIVFGSPVAGRTRTEFEPLIGLFLNMISVRVTVRPDEPFEELLTRTRSAALRALSHQALPFEQVVQGLAVERRANLSPVFQVSLSVNNLPDHPMELTGVRGERIDIELQGARYDLTTDFAPLPDGLRLRLQYNSDLFEPATARRLAGHLTTVLTAAARDPRTPVRLLPLLDGAERDTMLRLSAGDADGAVAPAEDVLTRLASQVDKAPDAPALHGDRGTLSYRQLDEASGRVAAALATHGVRPGDVVAVMMDRTPECVAAVLGIWKAAAGFLPIDRRQPADRLDHMLRETRAALLVVDERNRDPEGEAIGAGLPRLTYGSLPARPAPRPPDAPRPDQLAYVMYTSGSTGLPKGVRVSRAALASFCAAALDAVQPTDRDVALAVTTFAFDISLLEYLVPLLAGGSVRPLAGSAADVTAVQRALDAAPAVTLSGGTPTIWKSLLAAGLRLPDGIRLMLGGEPMPAELGPLLLNLGVEFWNFYGPTEATVYVAAARYRLATTGRPADQPRFAAADLGRPFGDNVVYVLDEGLQPCPVGVPGEVYLAGPQLAQGYQDRRGHSAERFVADPHGPPGGRMYRTGDVARWSAEGRLLFQGRADSQVKIRGFRVELAEIEHHLRAHPGVADAVVGVRERSGVPQLVARLVAAGDDPPEEAELRAHVARLLPEYMVPAVLTFTDALPVSGNGKVDRRAALALRDRDAAQAEQEARAGGDPVADLVRYLFADVLGRPVGADANFFELGGNSLLAVQVLLRLQDIFRRNFEVADVFAAPTAAALGARITAGGDGDDEVELVLPLRTHGSAPPVICLPPRTGRGWCYAGLLPHIPQEFPVWGLQSAELARGEEVSSVEDLVAECLDEIEELASYGPCVLLGWSFGGALAHELAGRLRGRGRDVPLVVMYDAVAPLRPDAPGQPADLLYFTAVEDGGGGRSQDWAGRYDGHVAVVPTGAAHLRMFDPQALAETGPALTARLGAVRDGTGR